jgi:hypothetical protein
MTNVDRLEIESDVATANEPWLVPYSEMLDSARLAMECEGIPPQTIKVVLATVEDFMANNWGDD